jgi:hypothetical protein
MAKWKWIGGLLVAIALAVLAAFVIWLGYWELVEERDGSRVDAEEARLFERGWLPVLIPHSARNIELVNDLDINTSEGSFEFDPRDAEGFIQAMTDGNDGSGILGENSRWDRLSEQGFGRHD